MILPPAHDAAGSEGLGFRFGAAGYVAQNILILCATDAYPASSAVFFAVCIVSHRSKAR